MTYGLVGEKLGHSYSKLIHESLGRYSYELFSLDREVFDKFIANRQYSGLNITIPYKKAVIPFCDRLTDSARRIGAVNTLYFQDGQLWGTNTDYDGFLYAAESAGISFHGKKVLILGNGGTSLTIRKAVCDKGAANILITSRRGEDGCISYEELCHHRDIEIIVNTTPVGTYPNNGQRLISLADFPRCCGVIDVIYNPFATDLLQQAEDRKIPHSNGLPMLVAQATAAAEHFLQEKGLREENVRILKDLRREIENIVLIGMPGCGKSSIGKRLAQSLGKTFVDLDEEVEKDAGQSIPSLFREYGEAYFRSLETQAAEKAGKEKSQVIAAGGGVILKPENMKALSQNGRVVFIRRPLEQLATDGRPLSKDAEALKAMYAHRLPLYEKYGQISFQAKEGIDTCVQALADLLY